MNSKLDKWQRWLDQIKWQMYTAMWSRRIFTETFELVRANEALPRHSSFYTALRIWYGDHVLMCLRRQLKSSPQSVSLVRLLEEIQAHPEYLSRARWRELHADFPIPDWADRSFDEFAPGRDAVDPAVVAEDIARLRSAAAGCEAYVDKRVAHHDRGGDPKAPTYEDLDQALDELDRVFRRYYLLVTARNVTTEPEFAYNWQKVFRRAWIPPAV